MTIKPTAPTSSNDEQPKTRLDSDSAARPARNVVLPENGTTGDALAHKPARKSAGRKRHDRSDTDNSDALGWLLRRAHCPRPGIRQMGGLCRRMSRRKSKSQLLFGAADRSLARSCEPRQGLRNFPESQLAAPATRASDVDRSDAPAGGRTRLRKRR